MRIPGIPLLESLFPDPWTRAYRRLREPKTTSDIRLDEPAIEEALADSPIPVVETRIDPDDCRQWIERANYPEHHPAYYPENLHEKSLEHYLAARLLALQPGETYIDIASQNTVAAEIYQRLHRVEAYAQDLEFPPGLHGRRIGGHAGSMPLPGAFADAMALHCSIEHFEADGDIRFLREAARVLKPGGRCAILPLYLANTYSCLTDPRLAADGQVPFEPDILLVALRTYTNRHGRFYDVPHLVERLWRHRGTLDMTLHIIRGYHLIHPSCYLRYALLLRQAA